ncbi:hypothetical protein PV08_04298 [Exophiala spinifera]|uniref:Yeast cell wall synthesis Kre9/Knh1-like N-terminal domain-containing protein n=1 Tax=Exophiala spinifera TaxID=91928 RepID=A0A0D1ZWQ2_9EURO|nr:uncharacterized protein PV08_04298 [Exophiala spinifera]KIW17107.1 hypothetical protein PV08_04298 [Exophiala spinifera]
MRFLSTAVAALCATVVAAQNNAISIPAGQSTLDVTAGQPLTIQWTDPSSGTVTIKLQQDPITPDGGITLASGVPASDGTATLDIPPADEVNSHLYTIEIIDDTDTTNINFSPNFGIQGATGTGVASASTASSTGTASTGSATGSSTASASNSTSTDSSSTSTESSAATTSGSSSSSSSESAAASTTSSSGSSATSSSASPSETTTAPDSNSGATGLKVQSGFLAMVVGAIAVL